MKRLHLLLSGKKDKKDKVAEQPRLGQLRKQEQLNSWLREEKFFEEQCLKNKLLEDELLKEALLKEKLNGQLYDAIFLNNVDQVRLLMDQGANANCKNEFDCTPLGLAFELYGNQCAPIIYSHVNFRQNDLQIFINTIKSVLNTRNAENLNIVLAFGKKQLSYNNYCQTLSSLKKILPEFNLTTEMVDVLTQFDSSPEMKTLAENCLNKIDNSNKKENIKIFIDTFNQSFSLFKLDSFLGSGSYGRVYKAKWNNDDVAIKFFRYKYAFDKESANHRMLTSPRIASYYFNGKYENNYYLVTELGDLGSLAKVILNETLIYSAIDAIKWLYDVASGLDYLHNQGYIHADLTPHNIIVSKYNGAKLIDFYSLTRRGDLDQGVATYVFKAPEVFLKGSFVSRKEDIYAFGVVAWCLGAKKELWTVNKITFSNYFPFALFTAVKKGLRPDISLNKITELNPLIEPCWSADPKKRPDASEAMALLNKIK